MPPRPKLDTPLLALGLLLIVAAYAALSAADRVGRAIERTQIERDAREAAEEQLEVRRQQLDGALEKITELKGDDEPAAAAE